MDLDFAWRGAGDGSFFARFNHLQWLSMGWRSASFSFLSAFRDAMTIMPITPAIKVIQAKRPWGSNKNIGLCCGKYQLCAKGVRSVLSLDNFRKKKKKKNHNWRRNRKKDSDVVKK